MSKATTAAERLAAHTECWDMPTLSEQHPEVIEYLSERYEIHFGMCSEVLVIHKETGAHEWMKDAEGKPVFDVRVAVQTLLVRERDAEKVGA